MFSPALNLFLACAVEVLATPAALEVIEIPASQHQIRVGDHGDSEYPTSSGIYWVELAGKKTHSFRFRGVQEATIPLGGVVAGEYTLTVHDGLGNKVMKRVKILGDHSKHKDDVDLSFAEKPRSNRSRTSKAGDLEEIAGGHTQSVLGAAFSQDSKILVSVGSDGKICRWDLAQKSVKCNGLGAGSGRPIRYTKDGRRLAVAAGKFVFFVDAKTLEPDPFKPATSQLSSMALSPDETQIVAGGNHSEGRYPIFAWDATKLRSSPREVGEHRHLIECLDYSPDGKILVSGALNGEIKIWNVATWDTVLKWKAPFGDGIQACSFSPDGKQLLIASSKAARLLSKDAGSWEVIRIFEEHKGPIFGATFSPDGRFIVTYSKKLALKRWSVRTGALDMDVESGTLYGTGVAYSPDGGWIAALSGDHTITIWDARRKRAKMRLGKPYVFENP